MNCRTFSSNLRTREKERKKATTTTIIICDVYGALRRFPRQHVLRLPQGNLLSSGESSWCSDRSELHCYITRRRKDPEPLLGTVARQTDFDVTIGPCGVYEGYVACAILNRHKTMSDDEVKVCLPPWQMIGSDTVLRQLDTTYSCCGSSRTLTSPSDSILHSYKAQHISCCPMVTSKSVCRTTVLGSKWGPLCHDGSSAVPDSMQHQLP